ncbi:MAG: asparagine synthase (glutamine-hydrolyzing), partial [Caulobacteraceae bacterium]|nr:asparagine synthase (glutamine-hydrolyzing) [Caulobacter sp.]
AAPVDAERLIAPLAHRGPDGVRVEATPGAALAHARLSIIDLEGGWQPITAAGSTLIGNGEIYNYLELTAEHGLESDLATGSDFEPLLHLYAREGPAAFARLRGMYAFCLLGCDGRTWLVRDAFGIKPLYLREDAGALRFASEPRSLRPERLSLEAAETHQLLSLHYLVGEGRLGVQRVPPGAVWRVEAGRVAERAELPAITPAPAVRRAAEPLLDRLDAVLEDSVRVHQRSDAPYGLFLSGGIDSAAVATLMARLNTRPVTAYTCGFDAPANGQGGAADERRAAERVARALKLDWRETTFTAEDFRRLAPQVAAALDDPTADYACLPTLKLAEAARGTLTVVLTGEGGDELFAGYGRYRRALRPPWLGGRTAGARYDAWLNRLQVDDTPRIRRRISEAPAEGVVEAWAEAVRRRGPPPGRPSRLHAAQWGDIATWLPDDLLLKLDRMLMAHGLEGRTPFLDREVAAFAWSLPQRELVRGRRGKHVLRRWLARACPAADPWARKQGFTVPVAGWLAEDGAGLAARIAAAGWLADAVHPDRLRQAFADPVLADRRWPLVFTALWTAIHRDRLSPEDAGAAVFG